VIMPGLAGRELAGAVRRLHPRAGVLFLTGNMVELGVLDATLSFLDKPFAPDMLVDEIIAVLAPGQPGAVGRWSFEEPCMARTGGMVMIRPEAKVRNWADSSTSSPS
jgi:hypothetical protein